MDAPTTLESFRSKEWHESKRFKALCVSIGVIVLIQILALITTVCLPNTKDAVAGTLKQITEYILYLAGLYIGGESLTSLARNIGLGKALAAPSTTSTTTVIPDRRSLPREIAGQVLDHYLPPNNLIANDDNDLPDPFVPTDEPDTSEELINDHGAN